MTTLGCDGKFNFFPGGPPLEHMTPQNTRFWPFFRYFQIRGFLEEKLGRQGKGTQNVWNELIDPCQKSWVHNCARFRENRFSKLKFFRNHPYLTLFCQGASR